MSEKPWLKGVLDRAKLEVEARTNAEGVIAALTRELEAAKVYRKRLLAVIEANHAEMERMAIRLVDQCDLWMAVVSERENKAALAAVIDRVSSRISDNQSREKAGIALRELHKSLIADRDAARAEVAKLKEQLDERCMRLRAAETLAKKVDEAVEGGWLGSRTPIADARLSLSDPFTYPETDAEIARLRAQIAELAGDQPAS